MPANTPVAVNTACGTAGGKTKCDAAGNCVGCIDVNDCGTPPMCKVNTCTAGVCGVADAAEASACDDGNKCTQADACQAGACVGSNPVVCTALDQCHNAGACVPITGMCATSLPKGDGAGCNDGNLCTKTDICQAGVCVGRNPVSCPPPDQCHNAGTCNQATGICSNPSKADGTTCTDGNSCTQTDTCQGGTCMGANPVICTSQDECHDIGICKMASGLCLQPLKGDGSPCGPGGTKTCLAGVCQ